MTKPTIAIFVLAAVASHLPMSASAQAVSTVVLTCTIDYELDDQIKGYTLDILKEGNADSENYSLSLEPICAACIAKPRKWSVTKKIGAAGVVYDGAEGRLEISDDFLPPTRTHLANFSGRALPGLSPVTFTCNN